MWGGAFWKAESLNGAKHTTSALHTYHKTIHKHRVYVSVDVEEVGSYLYFAVFLAKTGRAGRGDRWGKILSKCCKSEA